MYICTIITTHRKTNNRVRIGIFEPTPCYDIAHNVTTLNIPRSVTFVEYDNSL